MNGETREGALIVLAIVFAVSTILAGMCGDGGRLCLAFSFVILAGASVVAMLVIGEQGA